MLLLPPLIALLYQLEVLMLLALLLALLLTLPPLLLLPSTAPNPSSVAMVVGVIGAAPLP